MPAERHNLVGYFTDVAQTEPEYDPPHDGPCLVCWEPLTPDDVRTISLMPADGAIVSVFYRVHRTCAESDPQAAEKIEHAIIDGEFHRAFVPCDRAGFCVEAWGHGGDCRGVPERFSFTASEGGACDARDSHIHGCFADLGDCDDPEAHAKFAHPKPGPFRWRQRRVWAWLVHRMYGWGVIAGSISTGNADGWIVHGLCWRGERPYIFGRQKRMWGRWPVIHRLRYGHWPETVWMGMCGICGPWQCCGATGYDHAPGCREATS